MSGNYARVFSDHHDNYSASTSSIIVEAAFSGVAKLGGAQPE